MAGPLILASTSPYRGELLARLGVPFEARAPGIDETARPGEPAAALASRLARTKAEAAAGAVPGAVVIGADQVACLGKRVLGKPGTADRARAQLRAASGGEVAFLTAVTVLAPGGQRHHLDVTRVLFRSLTDDEIDRYVAVDAPLDCAGSFKAERLGIALFERIDARDPTGLIGLPLIWLAGALREFGYSVP